MSKKRLFVENFLVYGVGGILGKIISFIMVPIVTRLMPNTSYYGISDLTSTITSFASYLSIFGMYDAMYRMFFEKDDMLFKKKVCSTALSFVLIMSILVCTVLFIFRYRIASIVYGNQIYAYLVNIAVFTTFAGATNGIVSAPTRMQNHKKTFLILGLCSTLLSYSISVPMLIHRQYIIALPVAGLICGILYELVFICINNKWFDFKLFDLKLLKQLLIIAVPIVPNFLIYWIFNSSDKLMIQFFLGTSEVGIYSVGAKLGHLSNLIYTAFAGGWQYFAFATMKDENQVDVNSRIFEYLGIISFVCTSFICTISPLVYKLIFPVMYFRGYIISPYLFLSPLVQILYQVISNQFLVIKKTWLSFLILITSAIINVILNYLLIQKIGIEGAAIGTLCGFTFSVLITSFVLYRMNLFKYSLKFLIVSLLMICFFVGWRVIFKSNIILSLCISIIFAIIVFVIYYSDINKYFNLKKVLLKLQRK